jgi:RimJ/RimL family protein N-acetyltransferase
VEVGFRYLQSAWGCGIATEAAMPLVQSALADPATTAVVACAHAGNSGSLRVLQKLGLEHVGEVMLPEASAATVKLVRLK